MGDLLSRNLVILPATLSSFCQSGSRTVYLCCQGSRPGKHPLLLFDSNCLWDPDSFVLPPTHVSAESYYSALNQSENVLLFLVLFYTLVFTRVAFSKESQLRDSRATQP